MGKKMAKFAVFLEGNTLIVETSGGVLWEMWFQHKKTTGTDRKMVQNRINQIMLTSFLTRKQSYNT